MGHTMKISDIQKELTALIVIASLSVGGYTYFAKAEDMKALEKQIKDEKVLDRIKDINYQIEIAEAKKAAGMEGQDAIIQLLEKQRDQILIEQGIKN